MSNPSLVRPEKSEPDVTAVAVMVADAELDDDENAADLDDDDDDVAPPRDERWAFPGFGSPQWWTH